MYEKRFQPQATPDSIIESKEANLSSLLNPRLLGKMSAGSIQHYIEALIDSGHLPKPQDTPSFFTRSPTPGTQLITTPQYKPASDTTILETKTNEELKDFITTPLGFQIIKSIKENPSLSAKQVLENLSNKQEAKIRYTPNQQIPYLNTEKGVFGKPENRGSRLFDLEAEEKILADENSVARKLIKIPVLEINNFESSESGRLVTDSEVSGLSQAGSIGSEIFNVENPEFMGGFMEFIRKARELEEGQIPGNSDLSEGEVRMDYEGLSSGEIPTEIMNPLNFTVEKQERVRVSNSGLMSDEGYEPSEGEFDPNMIFKV